MAASEVVKIRSLSDIDTCQNNHGFVPILSISIT